jgi:hypothetical protein
MRRETVLERARLAQAVAQFAVRLIKGDHGRTLCQRPVREHAMKSGGQRGRSDQSRDFSLP